MSLDGKEEGQKVEAAFLKAISVLGPESSRLLFYHLE